MEGELNPAQKDYLASLIVGKWKEFARSCNVKDHEIERIDIDHRESVKEKAFQVLTFIQGVSITGLKWSFVRRKLEELEFLSIIREFEDKYPQLVKDCNAVTTHAVEESLEASNFVKSEDIVF